MKEHYRLAVQGNRNSTVVGRSYETIRQALGDVNRVNAERARQGLKPVTSLKRYSQNGTYRHVQYVGHYAED